MIQGENELAAKADMSPVKTARRDWGLITGKRRIKQRVFTLKDGKMSVNSYVWHEAKKAKQGTYSAHVTHTPSTR